MATSRDVLRVADPCGNTTRCFAPHDRQRCTFHRTPRRGEEPAGATLGAGSAGEGFDWIRPVRGPAMDGRPFSRDRSRVENPQAEPDPARRAISKRPLLGGPSLAGRRSRGPEGGTRRLLRRNASRAKREAEGEPTSRRIAAEAAPTHCRAAQKKRPPMGYRRPIWGDSLCPGVEPSPARALIIGIRV
jgi:hypothetical protein